MPTINNATVATGTGLSTAGNGGRKLVRLSNGNMYSVIKNGLNYTTYKSTDNGTTWIQHYTNAANTSLQDVALSSKGNHIYLTFALNNATVGFLAFLNESNTPAGATIDSSQTAVGNISLAINDAGTELHAAWSSKNSTYPNSFNIRYAKGTIAADGSVTWSAVEQVSVIDGSNTNVKNPSIALNGSNASIFAEQEFSSTNRIWVFSKSFAISDLPSATTGAWKNKRIFEIATHIQANTSAVFVPQSINGLANGRLWVAWHGKDATDSAKFNIRTSYSDDGGVTWATPTKQTTGNTYDQTNASLTADTQGKVLLTWDAQNATTTQTALKVFNGTWGATTALTGDGYTNVATLFDNTFKLAMTTPPLIRQSTSGVYFSGNYFTGASVTPASSALGDKTASSVLSYTVTPESGSTITSIVEKVNGTTVNTYSNPASLSRTFTIPLANWDALKYYNTHTISVTVTDSNGMTNTQTYTFNKALANDASLLEGTKAAKDGKDRISTKRDVLAGQVGLAAGSTFDAISAAISSNLKKSANGSATSSSTTLPFVGGNGSNNNANSVTFNGLSFLPSVITLSTADGTATTKFDFTTPGLVKIDYLENRTSASVTGVSFRLDGSYAYVTETAFRLPTFKASTVHNWTAIQ